MEELDTERLYTLARLSQSRVKTAYRSLSEARRFSAEIIELLSYLDTNKETENDNNDE